MCVKFNSGDCLDSVDTGGELFKNMFVANKKAA